MTGSAAPIVYSPFMNAEELLIIIHGSRNFSFKYTNIQQTQVSWIYYLDSNEVSNQDQNIWNSSAKDMVQLKRVKSIVYNLFRANY